MLSQTEQILQATVEALQRIGLAGFNLDLHLFDHYETSITDELGREAIEAGYRISPHKDSTITGLIKSSSLGTEKGSWEIAIYVENDYVASIVSIRSTMQEHIERLAEIA